MRRRAFTLIEMLLATALIAVMMGGVLMLLGGVNRDIQTMRRQALPEHGVLMELISRDIANATSVQASDEGRLVQMIGNVGIDGRSLKVDGRLARVTYSIDRRHVLRREQVYLDDPSRPQPWSGLAGAGMQALTVVRGGPGERRVRLVLATDRGGVLREVTTQ
jgi:prepilin-type N-terminal cleavage/methylation domain-containing protein